MVSDWQQAASGVLVAVGKRFVGMVMEELLSKFQPGTLPHCFVVQTLANLSVSNGRWQLGLDPLPPGPWASPSPVGPSVPCARQPRRPHAPPPKAEQEGRGPCGVQAGTGRGGDGRWRRVPVVRLLQCSARCPS